ncbi:MAG: SRPBCC family protein [Spongiibacteraceae bacterium]
MFKHTIYSDKVTINASKEEVWKVLTDLENYGEWNPFTNPVISTLEIGAPVELHVKMAIRGDRVSTEYVQSVDIDTTLAWGMTMGAKFLLVARRDQKLEVIDEHHCSYQTWDAFSGLLTPLVVALFGKDMLNGFNSVAYALRDKFSG